MEPIMSTFTPCSKMARNEYGVRFSKQHFIKSEDKSELLKELTDKIEGDQEGVQTQGKIPDIPKGPRQLNKVKQ
jgi:hypothetical protein